jgi:retron-type reverse transcriptase
MYPVIGPPCPMLECGWREFGMDQFFNLEKVNWILDADVRGFFDNSSHEWMVKFIEHRVAG